jgi:hypothetical protein
MPVGFVLLRLSCRLSDLPQGADFFAASAIVFG